MKLPIVVVLVLTTGCGSLPMTMRPNPEPLVSNQWCEIQPKDSEGRIVEADIDGAPVRDANGKIVTHSLEECEKANAAMQAAAFKEIMGR